MSGDDVLRAFSIIKSRLTQDEINALKKFAGQNDNENILEIFFQELIDYTIIKKPFYSSPRWNNLTKEEKLILGDRVYQWYLIIVSIDPYFQKRCLFSTDDELKIMIVFKGEGLKSRHEIELHINYLKSIRYDKIKEGNSDDMISWLDGLIKHYRDQIPENLPAPESDTIELTDSTNNDLYIFSDYVIDVLIEYHRTFNGLIFEKIPLESFLKLFRLNGECKIKFKPQLKGHFKYSISFIEKFHQIKGDFNDWFSKRIGGPYKNSKGRPKKNRDITDKIEKFFAKKLPSLNI